MTKDSGPAPSNKRGRLFAVATPIGNLADISPRALEVLRSVDVILAEDTRHSAKLLRRYDISVPVLSFHKFNERSRAQEITDRIIAEGIDVAIITDAGTPCISDPGVEIVRRAREAGVPVYGVSGPSAIATAVSVSGLPSEEFTFVGFLPRKTGDLRRALRDLRSRRISTFVLYESPRRVKALAEAIQAEFPEARACFCCEMTKVHERYYYGPIGDVIAQLSSDPMAWRGEYTAVVHVDHGEDKAKEGSGRTVGAITRDRANATASPERRPDGLSLEAALVEEMVTKGLTLKEAVPSVAETLGLPRKKVYQAGLRLRALFKETGFKQGEPTMSTLRPK